MAPYVDIVKKEVDEMLEKVKQLFMGISGKGMKNKILTPDVKELEEKSDKYNNYLKLLAEKAQNAIRITEKNDKLMFLGEYAEEYPEIHIVEVYEDVDKTVYRLDKK